MQVLAVSIASAVPRSLSAALAESRTASAGFAAEERPAFEKEIDFSKVTPRKLEAYLNERIFSGTIDVLEAATIMGQLGSTQMRDAPDVPFDLRGSLKGTTQFLVGQGNPIAAYYESLLKRIDIMEAESIHFSLEA